MPGSLAAATPGLFTRASGDYIADSEAGEGTHSDGAEKAWRDIVVPADAHTLTELVLQTVSV